MTPTIEREPEALAFEATQLRAVRSLTALSESSRETALRFARMLNDQLDRMALPSSSHLLLMKRAATVAHFASRTALTLSSYQGHDLRGQADALLRTMTAEDPAGAGAFAACRVRLALRQAIEEQQEADFAGSSGHED